MYDCLYFELCPSDNVPRVRDDNPLGREKIISLEFGEETGRERRQENLKSPILVILINC